MTTILMAGGGTGGHLFPALAIADAVHRIHPDWRIAFAGAHRGVEATVLPQRGLPHRLFQFEPIHRRQWWRNYKWPWLAPKLIVEIDRWLRQEQPSAVIGTGGYVSGPVVWRATVRGIPTGILELDVRPGIATRALTRAVDRIWLGTPEAQAFLPPSARDRIAVTGAPIIPPDQSISEPARRRLGLATDIATIVITGGSQGSLALNRVVAQWLADGGGDDRQIIWATGRGTHAEFAALHAPPRLQVVPFLDPITDAWAATHLAIARAGMMTLAELAAWGIPAVLIPLPTSAADHQLHNARAAAAAGAAVLVEQRELTADRLEGEVARLLNDREALATMGERALARGRPDAAAEIARRVVELVTG